MCNINSYKTRNRNIFFFSLEKERKHTSREKEQREREKTLKQAPHLACNPTQGLIPQLWVHDLSQNQEPKSRVRCSD